MRLKWVVDWHPGGICSYAMLVANFGGEMAVPTEPPYCLMYPMIHSDNILQKARTISTLQPALQGWAPAAAYAMSYFSMQT